MPDPFVTVHACDDAIEAEIVRDLLVDEGLAARIVGGQSVLASSRVDVPAAQAESARAVVAARLGDIRPPPAEEEDAAAGEDRRLSALFAAGAGLVCPGAGHLYARRHILGAVILAAQIAALTLMVAGNTRTASIAAVFACGLFLFDLVGGQLAVRAENRGARATRGRQLLTAAVLVAAVGAVAAVTGPLLERLQLHRRGGRGFDQQELRQGASDPAFLPFPLHLDLRR